MNYPEPITKLIDSYMLLPGIGRKTATRMAFYTLTMDKDDVQEFSENLLSAKNDLRSCSICGNITTEETCSICRDESRDQSTILVVEQPKDIMAIDDMNGYDGLYHVLGGVLSPVDGVGPENLNIKLLLNRLRDNSAVKELIIATNATPDGEATAQYLAKLVKPAGIKVTRLAHGLAVGSDIEYADGMTLKSAVQGRREI
ncbi:recombination mediator RecR [Companilactobacillus mishanensis]|uniref:Recombination protein RecR n=1 Tax=Companilactobacillus mishanensis TaxID=2486008 RepID=A0ABW9P6P5_9LACO|nr:recombination mediator RecR [Companilactobacillus mishanensis]MQS44828.1 recombination protein RecR [Companilactobacillus mishanensis]MQS89344.1 recombination protein RecR [Companilactobacillus mishanensis]